MTSSTVVPGVVWREKACATDPDLFFSSNLRNVHAAQRICASCPVLAECAQLALQMQPSDCVVASVWVPSAKKTQNGAALAHQQLAEVAASGAPAAAVSAKCGPKDRSIRWNDPEFQERVRDLYGARLSWRRIAIRLDCSVETARKALKVAQPEPAAPAPAPAPEPAVVVAPSKPRRAARKCVRDFGFQQRVMQLRVGDGRTWSEIAAELGCAVKTAQGAYSQVRSQEVAA
ncbi:WhiB family transcriptional regulator [Nocardia sp. IFM 10818]